MTASAAAGGDGGDYTLNYLGHTDWCLPALGELNIVYQNEGAIGGFYTSSGEAYWSSSEYYVSLANLEDFSSGGQGTYGKNYAYYVRCARHY